ncbi:cell surface protein, partial [Lactobacillus delbrueckii subsp. bulgaricus]
MTSIFYQYELLVRNALGEGVAMIFLPIVLLGMYRLVNASNHGWLCLCLGMTLLVYTHLITTVMCGIMLLFYLIFNVKKVLQNKLILVNLIKASVVSFLL